MRRHEIAQIDKKCFIKIARMEADGVRKSEKFVHREKKFFLK